MTNRNSRKAKRENQEEVSDEIMAKNFPELD